MKIFFALISFLLYSHFIHSQVVNADLEEWEEIVDPNMLPYFNPVAWHTTNLPAFHATNNAPAITVSEQNETERTYAIIESKTPGIDATFSGYIEQKISIQNVKSISYTSRCDSIELLGRCVVQLYTDDSFFPEYSDSTAIVEDNFSEKTILIDQSLFNGTDSVYLRFMAFGYDFPLQPEMKGHSVFHVDKVEIDFISSIDKPFLNESALNIYPNPSEDVIEIEVNIGLDPKHISIYDQLGRHITSIPYSSRLNISQLEKGTYLIVVDTEEGPISKRVVFF